jgi:hypothetical protein
MYLKGMCEFDYASFAFNSFCIVKRDVLSLTRHPFAFTLVSCSYGDG